MDEYRSADAILNLQQLVADYWNELDYRGGGKMHSFYTDDCSFVAGEHYSLAGSEGVKSFYDNRAALVASEFGGTRTTRHTYTNLSISLPAPDQAELSMVCINYSGAGAPPLMLSLGRPTVTVALRTPFDLAAYPAAPCHVAAYGILPPTLAALADAIAGAAPFPAGCRPPSPACTRPATASAARPVR